MALTRNETEAEDLVQGTYLHAMQGFDALRERSNLKAWLFTVMRNAWLKRLRRDQAAPEFVALDEDSTCQAGERNDPQRVYFRILERDEIRRALQRLPIHCNEIIFLRDIEGHSYKELAEIMDCPVGTVMSRLARARARAKLKRVLSSGQPVGHPQRMNTR